MSVILILLVISLSIGIFFLLGFLWSVRTGQYEDDTAPGARILFEDKPFHSNHNGTP